jgi:hypothetical protein
VGSVFRRWRPIELPNDLGRTFKDYTGKRIHEYLNAIRIKESLNKLANSDKKIVDIEFNIGFESLRAFNRVSTTPWAPRRPLGERRTGINDVISSWSQSKFDCDILISFFRNNLLKLNKTCLSYGHLQNY